MMTGDEKRDTAASVYVDSSTRVEELMGITRKPCRVHKSR
jgi:hypothetical protein